MPVYHFRLTETTTGEFRDVHVAADSKDEAEAVIYAQEMKKVNYFASPDEVKDWEAQLKAGTLSGRDKGRLFSHRQEAPYSFQKASKESD